jgi:hypothetical protein
MGGLRHGYGVVLGTLADYKRDDPNDFGRFMHGVITLAAPAGHYRCAVDVDTHDGAIQVNWRIHPLRIAEWAPLLALPNGWHKLPSVPGSGAVDYIRDPRLADLIFVPEYQERDPLSRHSEQFQLAPYMPHQQKIEKAQQIAGERPDRSDLERYPVGRSFQEAQPVKFRTAAGRIVFIHPPWNAGTSVQALVDLEAVIGNAARIAVFGEPFTVGKGVHNIHQNQGDPVDSEFAATNEIWQDGITVAIRNDGTASAFMNKFSSQVDETDNDGAPLA